MGREGGSGWRGGGGGGRGGGAAYGGLCYKTVQSYRYWIDLRREGRRGGGREGRGREGESYIDAQTPLGED